MISQNTSAVTVIADVDLNSIVELYDERVAKIEVRSVPYRPNVRSTMMRSILNSETVGLRQKIRGKKLLLMLGFFLPLESSKSKLFFELSEVAAEIHFEIQTPIHCRQQLSWEALSQHS